MLTQRDVEERARRCSACNSIALTLRSPLTRFVGQDGPVDRPHEYEAFLRVGRHRRLRLQVPEAAVSRVSCPNLVRPKSRSRHQLVADELGG